MTERIMHYWTNYGTLCWTTDARRQNSQCSALREEVTCERCLHNLAQLDKQRTDASLYGSGYVRTDADGKMTHVPLEDVLIKAPVTVTESRSK